MENNFHRRGIDTLPDPTKFQRRNSYNGKNPISPQPENIYKNRFQNSQGFQSADGRRWQTKEESIVANREYYNKIGRDITHKPEDPNAFNLANFHGFNKD